MNNDYIISPLSTTFQANNVNMPEVLRDIIEDYAPEFQTKMAQITLTFWESIRNIVLCVLTFGYWSHYQTHKYNQGLLDSEDGSGIPSAIEAIKWGANTRPYDGVFESMQRKEEYKEYEFAYAQYLPTERYQRDLRFTGKDLPFELSSPLRDKKIWAIQSKYKSVDSAESRLYHLYRPLDKNNIALIVERFHAVLNDNAKNWILRIFVKLNDLESVQIILNALRHDQNLLKDKHFPGIPGENNHRTSIVELAIKLRHYEILKLFVAQNLPIDPTDFDSAVSNQDKEAIRILLRSPSIKVQTTQLIDQIRRPVYDQEILEILIKHHKSPLTVAIIERNLFLIQKILNLGIKPNIEHLALLRLDEEIEYYELLLPYIPKSDKLTELVETNFKEASRLARASSAVLNTWQRFRASLDTETKESLD